jgi:general stress protein YciG
MLLNLVLLIYRVNVKMNDSAKLIKKFAGRKGGRRRVKKGFATNVELASEAGKKGMKSRWSKRKTTTETSLNK